MLKKLVSMGLISLIVVTTSMGGFALAPTKLQTVKPDASISGKRKPLKFKSF